MRQSAITYRPDIDGLRAVAVLAVIGYHAAPRLMVGGYVGVDVFFVISGFLISTIILRERDAGEFSLVDFYARRVRRLLPALSVVLIATALLGWFYLLPHEFRALGKHMLAGAAYVINFTLKHESGYFDGAAEEKPLLHLWSLGVEEQFYLIWPLLLLLVRERRTLTIVIAVLVAVSFTWSLYALTKNQASAFYLPHYRVWELGGGALLALFVLQRPAPLSHWLANVLSTLGLGLIVGAAVLLVEQRDYPGFRAIIPVAGALLAIVAGPHAFLNRAVLAHPFAAFIGLISYSLYLWHWPLLSFTHILGIHADVYAVGAVLTLTAGLAVATYFLVERPMRSARAGLAPSLIAATAVLGVIGAAIYHDRLAPRLDAVTYRDLGTASNDWYFPTGLTPMARVEDMKLFHRGSGGGAVLFLGDSNVEQYWPRVERILDSHRGAPPVIFATMGGCPPIPGVAREDAPRCRRFASHILQFADDPQIATVVIAAAWTPYLASGLYAIDGSGPLRLGSPGWNRALDSLRSVIRAFSASGKAVWLVLASPRGQTLDPGRNVRRTWMGGVSVRPLRLDRRSVAATWDAERAALRAVAESSGARIIDPLKSLCDESTCPGTTGDGHAIYMDSGHLRASYVREHAAFIDQTLDLTTGSLP